MWRQQRGASAFLLFVLCAGLGACDGVRDVQDDELGGDFQEEDVTAADRAAVTATDVSDWDEDRDGLLNDSEWSAYAGEELAGSGWDEDADGAIDEAEFDAAAARGPETEEGAPGRRVGAFATWDADDSGAIEEREWGEGWLRMHDGDGDGAVSPAELEGGPGWNP